MPISTSPDRKCARCGELKLYQGGSQKYCRPCRGLIRQEQKERQASAEEDLLEANSQLDEIEVALDEEPDDLTYEGLMKQLGAIWSSGKMPDGSPAPQTIQKEALRLIERHLVPADEVGELRISLVLDAHIRCADCSRNVMADLRVAESETKDLTGEGEDDEQA